MKNKIIKRVSILGIVANLFLFIIKLLVGLYGKSQSMIADSFNSIGDIFASFMTFIGNKISNIKNDENHNFGHEKAEYIFSMIISITIFIISLKLLYDSIVSLFNVNKTIFSFNLVIVSIITILIKFGLYIYTKILYKKTNSILLKSNNLDHRNDIFLTSTVLISVIFSRFNIYFVDGIAGIIISVCFLISGIKIFMESYNILMDVAIDSDTKNQVIKMILKNKRIVRIEDLYSLSVGYKFIIVLTIVVDGNLSTFESHKIANYTEKQILREFQDIKEVFIHIHPIKKIS